MKISIFSGAGRGGLTLVMWATIAGGVLPLSAGNEVAPPIASGHADPAWGSPLLGFGEKSNNAYTDGNIFVTLPLWSTIGTRDNLGGHYLYLEPYSSVGSGGEIANSLGLSWRHLFSSEPVAALHKTGEARFLEEGWFVGGNVFGDMLDTVHRNQLYQLGLGAEIGSRYLEFRGNYYLPLNGERLYDHQVNTQQFNSSSSSSNTTDQTIGSGYGTPYATGNSILQPYDSATYANTTTTTTHTTTTTRSVTDLYEGGKRGWDAETALLVPWVDQWMDVKALAGYLSFDSVPFGADRNSGPDRGWKVGAELRPVPAVVLTSMWYEDKNFDGAHWVTGIEFQIPLDRNWKDAFQFRRRHLAERLAEPVHRQNDAIHVGNGENQTASSSSTSSTTVSHATTLLSQSVGTVVIKNDLVFVNNGGAVGNGIQAGSATGTGVAENPVNTVQAGANIAGANSTGSGNVWTAYVQGGGPAYTEYVTTTGSTNYFGSSQPIQALGGKVFGGTSPNPVIIGNISADASANPAIQKVSVQGFTIFYGVNGEGGAAPISIFNVPSVTITNNSVQDAYNNGIDVRSEIGAANTVVISHNVVNNSGESGISLLTQTPGSSINATIQNNTVSTTGNSDDGITLFAFNGTQFAATITGNTVSNSNNNGISAYTDASSISLVLNQNTITNSAAFGIQLQADNSSSPITVNIGTPLINNVITGSGSGSMDANYTGNSGSIEINGVIYTLPASAP